VECLGSGKKSIPTHDGKKVSEENLCHPWGSDRKTRHRGSESEVPSQESIMENRGGHKRSSEGLMKETRHQGGEGPGMEGEKVGGSSIPLEGRRESLYE